MTVINTIHLGFKKNKSAKLQVLPEWRKQNFLPWWWDLGEEPIYKTGVPEEVSVVWLKYPWIMSHDLTDPSQLFLEEPYSFWEENLCYISPQCSETASVSVSLFLDLLLTLCWGHSWHALGNICGVTPSAFSVSTT